MTTFGTAAAGLLTAALGAIALSSCGSGSADSRTVADDAPAYVGQWRLTSLRSHGTAVDLSGVERRTMTLGRRSGLLFDGCNAHNLRFTVSGRRVSVTDDTQTAGVCAPGPWTRLMDAVSAVTTTSATRPGVPAVPVTYAVDGTELTLSAAPYALHFTRTATRVPADVPPAPVSSSGWRLGLSSNGSGPQRVYSGCAPLPPLAGGLIAIAGDGSALGSRRCRAGVESGAGWCASSWRWCSAPPLS